MIWSSSLDSFGSFTVSYYICMRFYYRRISEASSFRCPAASLVMISRMAALSRSTIEAIPWSARIWGSGAASLSGAFFVEHLEWFTSGAAPPLYFWHVQAMHLAMIGGLLCAWRWERAGGSLALLASVVFSANTAGPHFWLLLATTERPALAFIYCGVRRARRLKLRAGFGGGGGSRTRVRESPP